MTLKTTPSQGKQVRRLARKLCCNFVEGNCLLLDDGDIHKCIQIVSLYGIYCKYFRDAVLTADKELYVEIIKNQF